MDHCPLSLQRYFDSHGFVLNGADKRFGLTYLRFSNGALVVNLYKERADEVHIKIAGAKIPDADYSLRGVVAFISNDLQFTRGAIDAASLLQRYQSDLESFVSDTSSGKQLRVQFEDWLGNVAVGKALSSEGDTSEREAKSTKSWWRFW